LGSSGKRQGGQAAYRYATRNVQGFSSHSLREVCLGREGEASVVRNFASLKAFDPHASYQLEEFVG
jgi:hypothetical protein